MLHTAPLIAEWKLIFFFFRFGYTTLRGESRWREGPLTRPEMMIEVRADLRSLTNVSMPCCMTGHDLSEDMILKPRFVRAGLYFPTHPE
jgi:hypothetical protein